MQKNILIVCAMRKEAIRIAEKLELKLFDENTYRKNNITLLITGIGKQKSAISLTHYLCNNKKPDLIINIGYAGSTDIEIGSWVNIDNVYNYEWDIPGEERYSMSDFGNKKLILLKNKNLLVAPCYSAEAFVTKTDLKDSAVFDMELHSIAIICDINNIELLALKKISDNLSLENYYENINMKDVFELESFMDFIEHI